MLKNFESLKIYLGEYDMKGIILVAGNGTRLAPLTLSVSKPLLPVYDKPMIYYPLTTLIQAGIKDVLIITNAKDKQKFETLFGTGAELGMNISYEVQHVQRGIADAFMVGEKFIGNDNVCLILGDNIYHGDSMLPQLKASARLQNGAEIYGYHVADPRRFGVAVFDQNKNVTAVEEKPAEPKSNLAVTGLYFFDNSVVEIAKHIQPSKRGELEITDVINEYIKRGNCKLNELGKDVIWMDVGTFQSLNKASSLVETLQNVTSKYVACIEEQAFDAGFINNKQLGNTIEKQKKSDYGKYLESVYNANCQAQKEAQNITEHFLDKYQNQSTKLR